MLVMSVAVPSLAITSVNAVMSSLAMPSCPAASAMLASDLALKGMRVLISMKASLIAASSPSLISVVFATPAMALSKSLDDAMHASIASRILSSPAAIPAEASAADKASTPAFTRCAICEASSPVSDASRPKASMLLAQPSALFLASSRYLPLLANSRFSVFSFTCASLAFTV